MSTDHGGLFCAAKSNLGSFLRMIEELRQPGSERTDTRQAVRLAELWALGGLVPPGRRCRGSGRMEYRRR